VRRGAAWPAERPSSWLVVREAVSRWQVAHRRAVMVAKRRRRCPQEHGWGGPAGARWAWWPRRCGCGRAFVSVSVSSASVRCPVSGAGVQQHACLSTRLLSGVRCGCLGVQMSGVRCPAWVSGVRGFPRPLCPAGRLWRGGGGQAAAWLGWPASAWSPALSTASWSAAESEPGGRGWPRSAGLGEGSAWTWPSFVGGGWAVAGSTAWATGMGWMGAGIARWWRAGVRSEAATTLRGHRVRPRAESSGRCEPPGLDCDLRVRPWCGRSLQ
jgi:hypothetical protein